MGRDRAERHERSGKSKKADECNLLEHGFPLWFLGSVWGDAPHCAFLSSSPRATGEPMGEISKFNRLGRDVRRFWVAVLKPFTQAKLRFIVCVTL